MVVRGVVVPCRISAFAGYPRRPQLGGSAAFQNPMLHSTGANRARGR